MITTTEIPTYYSPLLLEQRIDSIVQLARLLRGALSEEDIFVDDDDAVIFRNLARELEDHAFHARGIFGLPRKLGQR